VHRCMPPRPSRVRAGDLPLRLPTETAGRLMDTPAPSRPIGSPDPHWYKRAVFYEALVRSFADSDGDGTGDLAGLTSKLDYLAWLGIDCLWLPPFFQSPLRDGGYDIAGYTEIPAEL